ncbi:hypothetical protein C499_16382 [Halogeometricum borinquense DSM 11551]|uniref:DUF7282 domain-containing protein n=1 Tax=Halogeometricum borinquense (strain ATCC 700274 / DSM 11551 / JCM 10706 / KCTC 4070 / PR3) TaxID=469382 RepID=E4NRD0_HALBP|nr:BGTF surface domain-containing protein [Halogeometricum borinquense]ADQ67971.1 hypothetical protein Hbor_24130 [Halogeometricum borinquense DSM 11551]ELY24108.1 hypothetical protein C499_16382 [Halogeometricum borinquense DSM 11551]
MQSIRTLTALAAVVLLVTAGPAPAFALSPDEHAHSSVEVDASAQSTFAQTDDSASGSFGSGDITVTRGDEVTFTVSHSGPANVTIGGPNNGLNLRIHLGGSGSSEITIDTYATNKNASEFVDGGSPELLSGKLSKPLEPADYFMNVSVGGDERDVTTLTVEPRGEMSAESLIAPSTVSPPASSSGKEGDADLGDLGGVLSSDNRLAPGEYAVMKVHESSLETSLNAEALSGNDASNGIKLNVTQTNPGPNRDPREYVATADPEANVTVLPQFEQDTVYFVLDTSKLPVQKQSEWNKYKMRLALTEENSLVDEDTVVAETAFQLDKPKVTLSPVNDSVHYPWDPDTFTVRGTTTRAPNTTLEVRLRSPKPDAFLLIEDATVDANREYEATFDLSDVTRGVNATLWTEDVRSGDQFFLKTAQEVSLVAPNASVRFENQSSDGAQVSLSHVEVPEGGFVRIHDAKGNGVGRSDYLAPGRYENVSAELSLPLYNEQTLRAELVTDDGDEAYSENDTEYRRSDWVVNDTARIEFGAPPTETPTTQTQTATPTPTPTPTPTATPYPVQTEEPLEPSGESTGTGIPLSPAVAVVALLAAAGLLVRRTEGEKDE